MPKAKTPDYTRKAIKKYHDNLDRIMIYTPKGTKDKIKELTGKSCNAFINELVIKELEKLENENK